MKDFFEYRALLNQVEENGPEDLVCFAYEQELGEVPIKQIMQCFCEMLTVTREIIVLVKDEDNALHWISYAMTWTGFDKKILNSEVVVYFHGDYPAQTVSNWTY